jgi:hypothetical protein
VLQNLSKIWQVSLATMKYTVNQLLEGQFVIYLALTVSIHHKDHENQPLDELMKKIMSRETKVHAEVPEVSERLQLAYHRDNIYVKVNGA